MNARRLARWITFGLVKNQHIGTKSKEVLYQELFSLYNTKEEFRGMDFDDKLNKTVQDIEKLEPADRKWLYRKLVDSF